MGASLLLGVLVTACPGLALLVQFAEAAEPAGVSVDAPVAASGVSATGEVPTAYVPSGTVPARRGTLVGTRQTLTPLAQEGT